VTVGSVDPDRYRKGSYKGELMRTAELIRADYGRDLVLMLSGGTDSEIVLRSFLQVGYTPRCVMIRFKDDYNDVDVVEAIDLCNQLNVPLEFVDFDVKDFLYSGEAAHFGNQLQCTQITYLMVYHTILKLGMPAVMGGEVFLRRDIGTQPSSWYYCFRENEDASAMRFTNTFGVSLVNEFFSYTPELLLHYLNRPEIQSLVSNRMNYKLSSVSSKNAILKTLVPELIERKKTHGFEKLIAFNFEAYRTLASQQILRLEPSLDGIEYNTIIKMLGSTL
jgi:hypothetical protein